MGPNPKTIGKYEIVATLGKGSMGVVFKGFDPLIGRFVAIKTIHPEADGFEQQEVKQRFLREAQAAGRMHHANIVSIYEYGEDPSGAFIAMEFVEGRTLSQALAEGRRFGLESIVEIMLGLLSALDYSHKLGVVHRDIKPANIMLTEAGEVKVADFGIAGLESSTLTRTGVMMGTPSYMAPEQLLGQKVDGRADIFSAGSVLYQLLTGERPFKGALASVMHQVAWVDPQWPSARNPGVPPQFDAVVAKAMAKSPEDRFQTAAAFRDALKAVFDASSETHRRSFGAVAATMDVPAPDVPWAAAMSVAPAPAAGAQSPPHAGEATVPMTRVQRGGTAGARRLGLVGAVAAGVVVVAGFVLLRPQGREPAPAAADARGQAAPAAPASAVEPRPAEAAAPRDEAAPPQKEPSVAARRAGEAFRDCAVCPEMVVIAPGQSTIVSASAESSAEPGRQAVSIAYRYAIGRYEVTRAEFAAFAAESGHQAKGCWTYDGQWSHRADLDWRTPGYEQQDQHPVTCVSWLDAQAYLGWLKKKTGQAYRLPSSSEWKHASGVDSESLGQAPRQREVCKLANVADLSAEQQYAGWTVHACRDGYVHTAPVGRFQPNSRGIHDMLGNVFEWVEDCWADSPRAAPADGSALLQGDCGQRVLHGGSWFTIPRYVDPEFRNRLQTSHRASSVGFRVMRPVAG